MAVEETIEQLRALGELIQDGRHALTNANAIFQNALSVAQVATTDSTTETIRGSVIDRVERVKTICMGLEDAIRWKIEDLQS